MGNEREIEKDSILHIRIASDKLGRYRKQAEAEGRTLSNWVEWHLDKVVTNTVKTKGRK